MKSEKEILEALNTLREVCIENEENCWDCILRNANNECGAIVNSIGDPYEKLSEWDLKNYDKPRLILN